MTAITKAGHDDVRLKATGESIVRCVRGLVLLLECTHHHLHNDATTVDTILTMINTARVQGHLARAALCRGRQQIK